MFLLWKQTLRTLIRLLLWKQSDLGPFCLQYRVQKTRSNVRDRVVQSVTCLTADLGVTSLIPAWSHAFAEIDHEIISTAILLPFADSFKKDYCQLQAKVCA